MESKRGGRPKITCLCAPTTHPGSFRCSLHRGSRAASSTNRVSPRGARAENKVKSMRDVLMQVIKPSSHGFHRRRSGAFVPRPSRFCSMMINGTAGSQGVAVAA